MKNAEYVSASEIGEFIYCKRGWWLQFNKKLRTNDAMIKGTVAHNRLATQIERHGKRYYKNLFLGLLLIISALIAFVVLLINFYFQIK